MKLIRTLDRDNMLQDGCVITVGSFDGVHMGHQAVLGQLKDNAKTLAIPAVVMTFEPQPREYFQGDAAPARLSRFREKYQQLAMLGIEHLVCLRFSERLASIRAEEFVQQLFVEALNIRRIIIGDDFRFGKDRDGDIHTLRAMGEKAGFDVVPVDSFAIDGERVSSSAIRHALKRSDFELAQKLLGRGYSISGRVGHGDRRGRQLGFPTANVELKRQTTPLLGVYAVRVSGLADESIPGVANIGTRPVFDGKKLLLEVHLLDFNEQIYGRHVSVEFARHLRGEQKFSGIEELKAQIARDIEKAREILTP